METYFYFDIQTLKVYKKNVFFIFFFAFLFFFFFYIIHSYNKTYPIYLLKPSNIIIISYNYHCLIVLVNQLNYFCNPSLFFEDSYNLMLLLIVFSNPYTQLLDQINYFILFLYFSFINLYSFLFNQYLLAVRMRPSFN